MKNIPDDGEPANHKSRVSSFVDGRRWFILSWIKREVFIHKNLSAKSFFGPIRCSYSIFEPIKSCKTRKMSRNDVFDTKNRSQDR